MLSHPSIPSHPSIRLAGRRGGWEEGVGGGGGGGRCFATPSHSRALHPNNPSTPQEEGGRGAGAEAQAQVRRCRGAGAGVEAQGRRGNPPRGRVLRF
jgi:hypothetical protein